MEKTILCRTFFCKECYIKDFPVDNQSVVLFQGEHQCYALQKTSNTSGRLCGYTPHIIVLQQVVKEEVLFTYSCGIVGCGFSIRETEKSEKGKKVYDVLLLKVNNSKLSIREWNALVNYRDVYYYIT